ncbi:MAG: hypothetical protein RIE77_13145 [Phycisphaerales bacterium]|jgi:hypothetical protein
MLDQSRKTLLGLTACVGLAIAAGTTQAQQADRRAPEARPDRPILTGPEVRERRMPGVETGFSDGAQQGRQAMGSMLPPQVFRRVMGELMSEEAPVEIRVSAEQRERISAHVRAFEQAVRRGDRSNDRAGQRSGKEQDRRRPSDRADRAARDERRATPQRRVRDQDAPMTDRARPDQREGAASDRRPSRNNRTMRAMAQLQNRVWAELSVAQQQHVHKAMEAWRATQSKEQLDRMRERYRKDIGARFDEMEGQRRPTDARGPARDGAVDAPGLEQWIATLPDGAQRRVRERLSNVPQERLDALKERWAGMSPESRQRLRDRLLQAPQQDAPRQPR